MKTEPLLKFVHHVHYVVHNRDDMVEYMEKNFNMKPSRVVEYSNGNKDALYDVGETHIQITEPTNPANGAGRHLAKHGPGVFHVAWGIADIDKAAKELAAKGNKLRGETGLTNSSRGYVAANINPESSHGLWFQLAEGQHTR